MDVLVDVLPGIAVLACAVVYGADMFAAIVLRSALSEVDDQTLTTTMGHVHRHGPRLIVPFATSVVTSVLSAVAALVAGRTAVAVASAVAVVALLVWVTVFVRVVQPINRAFTVAVAEEKALPDARALQRRWDSLLPARFTLQAIAVTALSTALALV